MASPTDSLSVADPRLTPTLAVANQTFRVVVTPHLGGESMRLRLTNRSRPAPLTVGAVSVAQQGRGAATSRPAAVTFAGEPSVVLPAGGDVVSDPLPFTVRQWQPVSVSVYVPGLSVGITQHFGGNATSFYTPPGSGDHSRDTTPGAYSLNTTSVPMVSGLDVDAPHSVSAVVAFGDSITDGYVADNFLGLPQSRSIVDTDVRYPDFLQRRFDAAGIRRPVLNAGISGNRVIADGLIPQFGQSAVGRSRFDLLAQSGVRDAIILEGINDLGIPVGSSPQQIIAGYKNLITRLHRAGIRVHLGTVLPSSNALVNGTLAPFANRGREVINAWIRRQKTTDSVIDFDAALRDQSRPSVLDPRYAGPDNLHPSAIGYRAMAAAVPLDLFA